MTNKRNLNKMKEGKSKTAKLGLTRAHIDRHNDQRKKKSEGRKGENIWSSTNFLSSK